MQENFNSDYAKFQLKIANFVLSQNFAARCEEYENLLGQMVSISPEDMKEYAEKSPAFLNARNKSLYLMEKIVLLHQELKEIFELNEKQIGTQYNYDLQALDALIAKKLKEAAFLLHEYEKSAEAGRKALEQLNNPFLAQAL